MSYFYDGFEDYYILNKSIVSDEEGGTLTKWDRGAVVKASFDLGGSSEIRQAQAQNLKTIFTATFPIDTPVQYDTYLESKESGDIYRITSDPQDNKTPSDATFQSCFATAVRTELPI